MASRPRRSSTAAVGFQTLGIGILALGPALAGLLPAQSYGVGCAVTAPTTPLLVAPRQPVAGSPFQLALVGVTPAPGNAVVWLGRSDTAWNRTPLPFDLTPLGLPGCALLAEPLLHVPVAVGRGGLGTLSLPGRAIVVGQRFYAQAASLGAGASLGGLTAGYRVVPRDVPFQLVVLPDTQYYSQRAEFSRQFVAQTDWVLRQGSDVAFVSHVGDIVQSGARYPVEWQRARGALDRLIGRVPHFAVIGNHDYDSVGNKANATAYTQNFPISRYAGASWFRGATVDGLNAYQVIEHGGVEYLHLGLEWRPRDTVLQWAQGILARHPRLPTIVSTHEHLGTGRPAPRRTGGHTGSSSGNNSGEDVYRKLIEPFPQVFLVHCGHVSGAGRRSGPTALGRVAHEILADFQRDPNGGNGFLRRMTFDRPGRRIEVRTFSPTYVAGATAGPDRSRDPDHNFDLTFDFGEHERWLAGHRRYRFREGQDFGAGVYGGTVDTHVANGGAGQRQPDRAYGHEASVWCDGNQGLEQGLIRFDGLVGSAAGQIPRGATIVRAILTLTTEGGNAQSSTGAAVYRLTRSFTEASTWRSLGAGIQVGIETSASPEFRSAGAVTNTGTRSFDVTASLQAWVRGVPNYGWAVIAAGTDGWSFRSSEWVGLVERPMLTVVVR